MQLSIAVLEAPREDTASGAIDLAVRIAAKYRLEDAILALPENWITPSPVPLEVYSSALEAVGKAWRGPVLGGLSYVERGESVVSMGLAWVDGGIVEVCEKLFPSRAVGERGRISPGAPHAPLEVSGVRIGCIACVDIFYPEVARRLTLQGAEILYNPAAIPVDRLDLWHSTLTARAAENTVFALGANSAGNTYPDSRLTGGGSIMVAPDGRRVPATLRGPLKVFRFDRERLEAARRRWAFYEDLVEGRVDLIKAPIPDYEPHSAGGAYGGPGRPVR